MTAALFLLFSYLLGSIPFSQIFPKLKGKDVTKSGTGNIGATNALVVAGPLIGFLSWFGDVAKGFLPAALALYYFYNPWLAVAAGVFAVLGHDFSIFLKFKGGKGIGTTGGVLIAFDPIFALFIVLFWALLILVTRYFIPSTIIVLLALPLVSLAIGKEVEFIVFSVLALLLALYTHRHDISRFISGKELRTSEAIKHYSQK